MLESGLEPANLTPAELERLAVLSEELGEVQQIIGKILRHGYEGYNPFDEKKTTNRYLIQVELGDILASIQLMHQEGDIEWQTLEQRKNAKLFKIGKWLHHNKVELESLVGDVK